MFVFVALQTTCFAEWHYLADTPSDSDSKLNNSWYIETESCYYSHKKGHCKVKCAYPEGGYAITDVRIDYNKKTIQLGQTREYNIHDVEVDYDEGWGDTVKVKQGHLSQEILNMNWHYGRNNVTK